MRYRNLIFGFVFILSLEMARAGDNDVPVHLFTCTIPSEILDVDISCVQRGTEFEIIEGSNLSHPANVIKIEKPVFKSDGSKCLFSFKSRGKEFFIDKTAGEMFTSAKVLGRKCSFSNNLKGCDSSDVKNNVPAKPGVDKGAR